MTQVKNPTKNKSADVINLLKADHKKVKDLFKEFEGMQDKQNSAEKKKEIVRQICQELTLHALAEEAIVYPAARKAIKDEDLMDEADVEHAGAKELIAQLETMNPEESHYNAKVTVLREYIEHHVKEEESEMFPKLQKSGVDRKEMAEELTHFKAEHEEEIKTDSSTRLDGRGTQNTGSSSGIRSTRGTNQTHRDPASDLPTDPIRHSSASKQAEAGKQSRKNKQGS